MKAYKTQVHTNYCTYIAPAGLAHEDERHPLPRFCSAPVRLLRASLATGASCRTSPLLPGACVSAARCCSTHPRAQPTLLVLSLFLRAPAQPSPPSSPVASGRGSFCEEGGRLGCIRHPLASAGRAGRRCEDGRRRRGQNDVHANPHSDWCLLVSTLYGMGCCVCDAGGASGSKGWFGCRG